MCFVVDFLIILSEFLGCDRVDITSVLCLIITVCALVMVIDSNRESIQTRLSSRSNNIVIDLSKYIVLELESAFVLSRTGHGIRAWFHGNVGMLSVRFRPFMTHSEEHTFYHHHDITTESAVGDTALRFIHCR